MTNRRNVLQGVAAAWLAGGVVRRPGVRAEQATPGLPEQGLGEVVVRLHTSQTAEIVDSLVERVIGEFAQRLAAVEGYVGYVAATIPDAPAQHVTISLFETAGAADASTTAAAAFHEGLPAEFDDVAMEAFPATMYIAERPDLTDGTPTPAGEALDLTGAYVTIRIHRGKPGKDQRELAPVIADAFRVVLAGVPGFRAYVWSAAREYRVSINIFDTPEAAAEANERSKAYVNTSLADYTEGDSRVLIGHVAYADLPFLGILA
jgi:hypothetical protein